MNIIYFNVTIYSDVKWARKRVKQNFRWKNGTFAKIFLSAELEGKSHRRFITNQGKKGEIKNNTILSVTAILSTRKS